MSKSLGPLLDHQVKQTTIEECLTATADKLRQLYTTFGLRPYRVFLVWVGWDRDVNADVFVPIEGSSSADVEISMSRQEGLLDASTEGAGRATLLKSIEILPTPLVHGLSGVGGNLDAVGVTEDGTVTISQISAGYTEDQLQGLIPGFRDPNYPDTLKKGVSFFWEIQENRPSRYAIPGTAAASQFPPDPLRSPRRRFHGNVTPSRRADAFEWTVTLARADGERGRNGEIADVEGVSSAD